MSRFASVVASVVVLFWCASLCLGVEMVRAKSSAGALQKLRAPVSREAVVSALLANPQTKAYLTEAASKRGISADRIGTLAVTALPLGTAFVPRQTADQQLRDLNWAGGFTFTPFSSPTYGTSNWRLGVLDVKNVRLRTWAPNLVGVEPHTTNEVSEIITLTVELPMEPALYAITIKLVNQQSGKCDPTWVLRGGAPRAGLEAKLQTVASGSFRYANPALIPLTTLPDLTGFVGLVSLSPTESKSGGQYGMRNMTCLVHLDIESQGHYGLGYLFLGGITVMRM